MKSFIASMMDVFWTYPGIPHTKNEKRSTRQRHNKDLDVIDRALSCPDTCGVCATACRDIFPNTRTDEKHSVGKASSAGAIDTSKPTLSAAGARARNNAKGTQKKRSRT